MTRRIRALLGGTASLLIVGTQPVLADVTPEQVWEGFRTYLETSGYTVSADRNDAGGNVVVAGLTATMAMPEENGALVFEASEVVFEDQGDGTVLILFPESMPITITTDTDDEPETVVSLDYSHSGLAIVASGTEAKTRYDLSADRLGIDLAGITVDGTPLPEEMGNGSFAMAGMSGSMSLDYGDLLQVTQAMEIAELSYGVSFTDPETGDTGNLSGALTEVAMEGSGDIPEIKPDLTGEALIKAGLKARATFSYATGQSQFSGTSDGDAAEGQSSSSGGSFAFALSEDGMQYDVGTENLQMSATVPDLPFPVSASADRIQLAFSVPVMASDDPQDFKLLLQLAGLEMADVIWSMLDPQEILPRDPATLIVDVTGQVTTFLSILDPEAMEAADGAPGEVNSVTINALQLMAAGAEMKGEGAFTFNNDDLETFDGMPAPTGEATLSLEGGNALIDKLIEMGIMSEEDAMGARMMISMFSVPGGGADRLTSTVTITEEGQILANGQRIR
ncbi:DUF2125 domain-containing protein [Roseivivax sp. CAU 1753]